MFTMKPSLLGPLHLAPEDEARVADERLAARRVDVADDAGGARAARCAGCHGISAKVPMSGMRYWSDSAIRVKPSIDEPSNHVPCSTEPVELVDRDRDGLDDPQDVA